MVHEEPPAHLCGVAQSRLFSRKFFIDENKAYRRSMAAIPWHPLSGVQLRQIRSVPNSGDASKARILKQSKANGRHWSVTLSHNGKRETKYVHRLVMEVFNPWRPGLPKYVTHWDDDPNNNHISDLCWGSPQTNAWDRGFNSPTKNVQHIPGVLFAKGTDEVVAELSAMSGQDDGEIFALIVMGKLTPIERV